jgi:hypothetical protein
MTDQPENTPPAQPLDYESPKLHSLVAVAHFSDEAEAHMAAARLEGEDIGVEIKRQMESPLDGLTVLGAVLAVHPDDVAQAIAVLEQTPARERIIRPTREQDEGISRSDT